ncbi:uncharacterized protein LOC131151231 [Malania oleifera]|uniref:uncharacterized protein LOC131151231 n=1 Tax=Malania oleifera TaxID=397392 RepID=UPI0025AE60D4|nr:uncharacterized protein LOC131151231 [Malania oleifera]
MGRELYRRSLTLPYLRCLSKDEGEYILREIHDGVCGNHLASRALAYKAMRQGFYWPTMKKDAVELVKKCDRCQRWTEELPSLMWAYHTTKRAATRETPFMLVFGAEAVIPAEVGIPSWRRQ